MRGRGLEGVPEVVRAAVESVRAGRMVLIYDADDREGETDLALPALATAPADVARMRRDGGGLICVAIHGVAAERLGLPFMSDVLRSVDGFPEVKKLVEREGDVPYDRRSAFSLWVNHRATFTGVTDRDRALTIRKIGEAVRSVLNGERYDFGAEFRTPGHVAILRAADRLVRERRGQTELSVALALLAGVTPAMVICEMLDAGTGLALSKRDAKAYAAEHGLVFVEGKDIVRACEVAGLV
ncbi:MAG: 3,4-dihydroxy-2-butanone-4-phosphate synthase [Candidatus Alkanophagales archaeon]